MGPGAAPGSQGKVAGSHWGVLSRCPVLSSGAGGRWWQHEAVSLATLHEVSVY